MKNIHKYTALPEHARCRVLIFDSASILAKNLTDILHGLGYVDVRSLFSAKLVMATLLKTVRYHAVLVDLSLPELEGLRLIYQIREHFSAAELPILAVADVDNPDVCNAALLAGANDFLAKPVDPVNLALRLRNQLTINSLHNSTRIVRHQLERQVASSSAKLAMLIDNSALMATTQDRPALIRHTLFEGKRLLHCDAASMYLVTDQNSLRFTMRTRDDALVSNDIPLFDPATGQPNERYVSTYCALHKRSVVIDDVYTETRFDLSGTREFDAHSGYRTVSLLTVPMVSGDGKVVGVLQYINKLDTVSASFAPFHPDLIALVEALASQVAVALDNLHLNEVRLKQEDARRRLAIRLARMDRQRGLENMSAALGQELAQPLSAIRTQVQAARQAIAEGSAGVAQCAQRLDTILHHTEVAHGMVERIQGYSSHPQGLAQPVDLNAVLLDVVELLGDDASNGHVHFRLPPDSCALQVLGDPVQLSQVLFNLLHNAMDAVQQVERREILVSMHSEGAQVVVQIHDTGSGLDAQALKQAGLDLAATSLSGPGMGLAIARGIVAQHAGALTIANAPAGGALVELRLPLHEPAGHGAGKAKADPALGLLGQSP